MKNYDDPLYFVESGHDIYMLYDSIGPFESYKSAKKEYDLLTKHRCKRIIQVNFTVAGNPLNSKVMTFKY